MTDSTRFVRIENVTRGTVVGERVRVASSSRDRTVGLLRTPELMPGEGLWIERSPSIHMFFMPYAIDAVFLSSSGRVTKIAANLRPWRVVWWARGARDCLELRAGTAASSATQVGDELRLVDLSSVAARLHASGDSGST
ncbi:MAG: DUF192 domain-containing protein [Candidatus Limnocylindria bacterium]